MLVIGPQHAEKGDPVAVVYYICDTTKVKGGKCTPPPRGGLYYVHNGVAVEDLPTSRGGARVHHVAQWLNTTVQPRPRIDELRICGPEEAVDPQGVKCHPTTGTDRWVVKAIYTYSVGEPITWVIGNDLNDPHNGVFKCFEKQGQCDPDITHIMKAAGPATFDGNLEFWHYVNINPGPGESGRTATSWEKFTLQSGWAREKGKSGKIQIAKM